MRLIAVSVVVSPILLKLQGLSSVLSLLSWLEPSTWLQISKPLCDAQPCTFLWPQHIIIHLIFCLELFQVSPRGIRKLWELSLNLKSFQLLITELPYSRCLLIVLRILVLILPIRIELSLFTPLRELPLSSIVSLVLAIVPTLPHSLFHSIVEANCSSSVWISFANMILTIPIPLRSSSDSLGAKVQLLKIIKAKWVLFFLVHRMVSDFV